MRSNYNRKPDALRENSRVYFIIALAVLVSVMCVAVVSAAQIEDTPTAVTGGEIPGFEVYDGELLAETVSGVFRNSAGIADPYETQASETETDDTESDTTETEETKKEETEAAEPTYKELFDYEKPFAAEFAKYNADADGFVYLDIIPLAKNEQKYIYFISRKYGVKYSLVLAVIEHESGFIPNAVSKSGNDHGLMQINVRNADYFERNLGVDNLDNPYQNIQAGAWLLGNLVAKYGDYSKVLMSYNCGEGGANKLWESGILSTSYSEEVSAGAAAFEAMLR